MGVGAVGEQPDTFTTPRAMRRLLDAALAHRRALMVQHATSFDGDPFVTVQVAWKDANRVPVKITATWHTHPTGTYRLMSVIGVWYRQPGRDLTLIKALAMIKTGVVE